MVFRARHSAFDGKHVSFIRSFIGAIAVGFTRILADCAGEYYRQRLASCGEDVVFYPGVSVVMPKTISIGNSTHLGDRCHSRGGGRIAIGEWWQIANNVIIASGNHPIDGGRYCGKTVFKDILIGNNVWIGSGAIIMPGITIGDNSFVAAGAVVTRPVEANVIVAGVPARVIGAVPTKDSHETDNRK